MILIKKNERMKEARFRLKMPQIVLSLETGINTSTISRIECGYIKPAARQKTAIAAALGCGADWLFSEELKGGGNGCKKEDV
jgi:transcriptional regulator with XRE-family HTH domain